MGGTLELVAVGRQKQEEDHAYVVKSLFILGYEYLAQQWCLTFVQEKLYIMMKQSPVSQSISTQTKRKILRLACKSKAGVTIMNSDQSNGDYETLKDQMKQWEEDLEKLRGRIVGVEGDLMAQQLATNNCTDLTPTANVSSIVEIED